MHVHWIVYFLLWTQVPTAAPPTSLPEGFCYAETIVNHLKLDLRYYTTRNFLGRRVKSYEANRAIMTCAAAEALRQATKELLIDSLAFILYDAYRPQSAVDDFVAWSKLAVDTVQKQNYYPSYDKTQLFPLGYISSRSAHCRGSTLDIGLYDLRTNKELDMGSPFDFFGEPSHHDFQQLTKQQLSNRATLKNIMTAYGFRSYAKEWWHYTLNSEPFPETSFNFPIR